MRCDLNEPIERGTRPARALSFIEAGEGETLLLLHGSASNAASWQGVIDALKPLYRVVAPNLIGYGSSTAWPADAPFSLEDEVKALARLLPDNDGYHVVGYSYGGTVALTLALANPSRLRTLTLIEPVFFPALRYGRTLEDAEAYECFCRVRTNFARQVAQGERESAMQQFIDFWIGEGSWAALPQPARETLTKLADKIVLEWQAVFAADPGANRLTFVAPMTLLIRGDRSPAPMQQLVHALKRVMYESTLAVIPGADHRLPMTHQQAVIEALIQHLHAEAERELR